MAIVLGAQIVGSEKVLRVLSDAGPAVRRRLLDEMNRQTIRLQNIVVQKLSGPVLKNRTGLLRESINQRVTESANELRGSVGTNVKYGAVHELGGTFTIPAHIAHWKNGPARGQARVDSWEVRAHEATFPQRSFLRSTLTEESATTIQAFKAALSAAVQEAKGA